MPGPLAFAAAGFGLLGGVLGGVGKLEKGNEALRQGEIQAQLITRNLEVGRITTRQRIRDINRNFESLAGRQVAAFSKGGVQAGTGSALLTQRETAREQRLSTLREEFNFDVEAAFAPFQASEARRAGKVAVKQARLGAAASLLGGLGGAFSALNS